MKSRLITIIGLVGIVLMSSVFTAEDISVSADISHHHITLSDASELTAAWHAKNPGETYATIFPAEVYHALLNQESVTHIRSYSAINLEGNNTLVLLGVDSDGNDIVDGLLFELGPQCPPYCGLASSLSETVAPIL